MAITRQMFEALQPGVSELTRQRNENQRAQAEASLREYLQAKEPEIAGQKQAAQNEANLNTLTNPRLKGFLRPGGSASVGDIKVGQELKPAMLLTPAQEAAEKTAGKAFADYEAEGGKANIDKNLNLLESAEKDLKSADRGFFTQAAGALPRTLREYLTPDEVAREDKVKLAVQATLRQTLGAQFTEKEGEQLMNRAYNPRLSTEENMRRVKAAADELRNKKAQMEGSAEKYRTTGYATIGGVPPMRTSSKSSALQKQAPQSGPHGDAVVQDGVTYHWNPQSGQYE